MAFIRGRWRETIPGAAIATASWFLATLLYGWYVTRFADYSIVYGSLGAAIATLVWLYMISLSVLIGAEFNAQLYPFLDLRVIPVTDEEIPSEPAVLSNNPASNPTILPPHAARSAAAR
jgi:uncharacterized BrkB/YihY/UPF0761 family membrane protein